MVEEDKKDKKPESEADADEESQLMPDPMDAMGDAMNMDNYFPGNDENEFRSLNSEEGTPILQQCCCCICNCETKGTQGMTCCCIVPIKCGVTTIGILTILLAAIGISAQFFLMLNDRVAWWYCLVNLILLVPQYIAASFFIVWFGKDNVNNRGTLGCTCIMVVVSQALLATWAVIYFVWVYEGDTVYWGWGTTEEGYIKYQKKYFIFRELAWAVIVLVAYSYFICVVNRYSSNLRAERSDEEKADFKKKKADEVRAEQALDAIAKNKGKPVKPKKKKAKKAEE